MSRASQGKTRPSKAPEPASSKPAPAEAFVDAESVEQIDALFATAALVRSLRGNAGGVTGRMRLNRSKERAEPSELSRPAPAPQVASNGVEWLRVPGWAQTRWLWHGFSTRRGGLSRAYCPDDAPGVLGLTFP